jgi:hypothetical protein
MKSNNKNNRGSQEVFVKPGGNESRSALLQESPPEAASRHHWSRKVIDGTVIVALASFFFAGGRLYNTVSDLKEDRDKISERHRQILDDIAKAKTQALSQIQATGLRYTNTVLLNRGKTVLHLEPSRNGQLVTLRLVGDGYDYRYWLAVVHNGYGEKGRHELLATLHSLNTAGLGAPRISVDDEGNLHLDNEEYPHGKIKAYYSVIRIGD